MITEPAERKSEKDDPAQLWTMIRELRVECASWRTRLRATERQLAEVKGVLAGFREFTDSLGKRPRP